jgi:hypothetical protein
MSRILHGRRQKAGRQLEIMAVAGVITLSQALEKVELDRCGVTVVLIAEPP